MTTLHLPCLFGLEAPLARELERLGYLPEQIVVNDAQVSLQIPDFEAAKAHCARLNFWLRTAERVLFEVASFPVSDFDSLFEGCRAVPWEEFLDRDYSIVVKGYSRKSKLFGVPACQRIIKKAVVERLLQVRGGSGTLLEDRRKGEHLLQFAIVEDHISLRLDSSGEGLHKRGYRPLKHAAPIRETLAAGILQLSQWPERAQRGEVLFDPFSGSGTFSIEAALLLAGRAPGLKRHFRFEHAALGGQAIYDRERERAKIAEREYQATYPLPAAAIFAADIDPASVRLSEANAKRAAVEGLVRLKRAAVEDWSRSSLKAYCAADDMLLVANPPYGERLANSETADRVLKALGRLVFDQLGCLSPGLRLSLITEDRRAEEKLRARADKRRKLYNGLLPCTLYQFFRHPKLQ